MRKPVVTSTVEWSIDQYVQHSLAGWFETGAQAAPQMTTSQLADYYRNMAVQAYAQLGADYALGPDILLYAQGNLHVHVGSRAICVPSGAMVTWPNRPASAPAPRGHGSRARHSTVRLGHRAQARAQAAQHHRRRQ